MKPKLSRGEMRQFVGLSVRRVLRTKKASVLKPKQKVESKNLFDQRQKNAELLDPALKPLAFYEVVDR